MNKYINVSKKLSILIILIFIFIENLAAMQAFDESNKLVKNMIGISIDTDIGYISGISREIVYPNFSSINPYLSELIWELNNIFIAGGHFSINIFNAFSLNGGIWTGINSQTGEMNDYDWFYYNLSHWTHKSNHSIFLNNSLFYDINSTINLINYNDFYFSLILGFKQNYISWKDKPNSFIYTTTNQNSTYIEGISELNNYEGLFYIDTSITYRVLYSIPYFGFSLKYLFYPFQTNYIFAYTFLTTAEDQDYHIQRKLYFLDSFTNCQTLLSGFNVKFYLNKYLFFNISSLIQFIFESRGDTAIYDDAKNFLNQYKNGAGIQYFTFSILSSIGVEL